MRKEVYNINHQKRTERARAVISVVRSTEYAKFGRNIWVRISSRQRLFFLFFLSLSFYRYSYACTHINTNSSQMFSLYVISSSSSSYWGKLYIGSDDIVLSALFSSFLSLSHTPAYSPTEIFTQYLARCLGWWWWWWWWWCWKQSFSTQKYFVRCWSRHFLCRIWNRTIETDRERERGRNQENNCVVFIFISD